MIKNYSDNFVLIKTTTHRPTRTTTFTKQNKKKQ